MRVIKVFPDYCSSGLWEGGANCDESEFEGVLNASDFVALKYWHFIWECFADDGCSTKLVKLSPSFWEQWVKDGKDMVDGWNTKQDVFKFVYKGDYWR